VPCEAQKEREANLILFPSGRRGGGVGHLGHFQQGSESVRASRVGRANFPDKLGGEISSFLPDEGIN
jgi:hypothetical protein